MEEKIVDLSDIRGFERLYVSLAQREDGISRDLPELLYDWYRANLAAQEENDGREIKPIRKGIFVERMAHSKAEAYRTEVQLIRALSLLDWNISEKEPFQVSNQRLRDILQTCQEIFRHENGYSAQSGLSAWNICEESLNPEIEPRTNLNMVDARKRETQGPKFIYICAPLRGEAEKNIAYARQRAKEVFAEGNIPICPHLMFPPIANPKNREEDEKAMEMCLYLMEQCHEVRVFGPEWTEGMWKEIRHAHRIGIPVLTDQRSIPQKRKRIQER